MVSETLKSVSHYQKRPHKCHNLTYICFWPRMCIFVDEYGGMYINRKHWIWSPIIGEIIGWIELKFEPYINESLESLPFVDKSINQFLRKSFLNIEKRGFFKGQLWSDWSLIGLWQSSFQHNFIWYPQKRFCSHFIGTPDFLVVPAVLEFFSLITCHRTGSYYFQNDNYF